jgi:hypothetical protein
VFAEQVVLIDIGPDGQSLDLLQAIYRNVSLPLSTRRSAAVAALPFEFPKLAVTAFVPEGGRLLCS